MLLNIKVFVNRKIIPKYHKYLHFMHILTVSPVNHSVYSRTFII